MTPDLHHLILKKHHPLLINQKKKLEYMYTALKSRTYTVTSNGTPTGGFYLTLYVACDCLDMTLSACTLFMLFLLAFIRSLDEQSSFKLLVTFLPDRESSFILLDQEIHFHALSSGLLVPPAFSRKVIRVFPPLHRSQILRLAGLHDYCELHGDKCTVYENNVIWPAQDRTVHPLTHGAYLRIIVPPPDDPALDTELAITISREFAIEEPATSPATLTAACSEEGPRPSGEGDSSALFQNALRCFQKTCTSTLQGLTPLQAKIAPEHVRGSHLAASSSGTNQQPLQQRPLSRFFGRDFDTLQNFFRSQALLECEEEGRIAYVDTWYIHHDRRPRCEAPRAVKLFQDPAEWLTDILHPWDDEIDPTQDIMIYLVRTTPPCTPFECILAHLIIEQVPRPDHAVALISIQDSRFRDQPSTTKLSRCTPS